MRFGAQLASAAQVRGKSPFAMARTAASAPTFRAKIDVDWCFEGVDPPLLAVCGLGRVGRACYGSSCGVGHCSTTRSSTK